MSETPDTVTPLDGDGHNVVMGEDFSPFDEESGNINEEYYETRGKTTVATRPGYAFQPSDKGLPVITHTGVRMTKEQAEQVVAESTSTRAGVHIVTSEEEE